MVPGVLNTPPELVRPLLLPGHWLFLSGSGLPPGPTALSIFHLPDASFSRTPSLGKCTAAQGDPACIRSAGLGPEGLFRPHFSSGPPVLASVLAQLPLSAFVRLSHQPIPRQTRTRAHVTQTSVFQGLQPHSKYLSVINQSLGFLPSVACGGPVCAAPGSSCRRWGHRVAPRLLLPQCLLAGLPKSFGRIWASHSTNNARGRLQESPYHSSSPGACCPSGREPLFRRGVLPLLPAKGCP